MTIKSKVRCNLCLKYTCRFGENSNLKTASCNPQRFVHIVEMCA